MAKTKCAHLPCTCQVSEDGPYGDYCSEYCPDAGAKMVEVFCECHHSGCGGAYP